MGGGGGVSGGVGLGDVSGKELDGGGGGGGWGLSMEGVGLGGCQWRELDCGGWGKFF